MQLREVLGDAARDAPPVEVTALAFDNRLVTPGTLFFCVPGFTRDGHDYAPDAIARGAAALVVQRPLGLGVPEVLVDDVRAAMAPAAAALNGAPTAALRAVGITGTNGKTTTAFLVRGLLEAAGRRTGLLGTIKTIVAGADQTGVRTTPEAIDLQAAFRAMADGGDVACAMEVSSHALELNRADAIHFDVAVFTNLTQDHLDFHPSMEAYWAAKKKLFALGPRVSVVNVDDEHGRELADERPEAVTVAIDRPATLRATALASGVDGSSFVVEAPEGPFPMRLPVPGRFNVLNALGAAGAVRALGVGLDAVAEALPGVARVPGRFEPVEAGQPFAVVVDYSHTPDGLENVLVAAREVADGRVICVFGCGGDRDRGKRPPMGRVADARADRAIVTSDNPRSEDPEAIIAEVLAGMGAGAEHEADRRAAIRLAVGGAEAGDVVVIAGKGHEQGQELAEGVKVPFDDVEV